MADDDFDDGYNECYGCGEPEDFCACPLNGADDEDDPERYGHAPDPDDELLDSAIYLAEQARDVLALKYLLAERDGVPPCKVWPRFDPEPTRKHKLRTRRREKARERRALERGRRSAHRAGLDVRAVEVVRGWTTPEDTTALCGAFVVWEDGGERVEQVLDIDRRGGDPDDIPW